jgi:hypothetical protein
MAGRDREPDLVGELLHGDAAVGLQMTEDFSVDGIELRHWDKLYPDRVVLRKYTNIGGDSAKI